MNIEDVLKIVGDCRHTFDKTFQEFTFDEEGIMELANAIAAHEREECAKIASNGQQALLGGGIADIPYAIRSRGTKEQ